MSSWVGQGGCELRSEAFVKIQKKKVFLWGGGRVGGEGGGSGRGEGSGQGGGRVGGGGVRVDVNGEV